MISSLINNPLVFIFWVASFVIAITIHEFSHAFAADKLGDPTPKLQGRLTLNPLAHLDPLGSIMIVIANFGWGKPVQFDPYNLKNPRRDAAVISFAGPASNIVLALLLSLILRFIPSLTIAQFLIPVISLNVMLAVFNLIPIHPLDGFKIVGGLLPDAQAKEWYTLERYGFFLLVLLILPIFGKPIIANFLFPVINAILSLLL